MQLAHHGLTIFHIEDVNRFYQDLLGMTLQYEFEIPAAQCQKIFGVARDVPVFMLRTDNISLELFFAPEEPLPQGSRFAHLCFSVENRKELVDRAIQMGFRADVFPRPQGDLIFIFDNSGNRFEVK